MKGSFRSHFNLREFGTTVQSSLSLRNSLRKPRCPVLFPGVPLFSCYRNTLCTLNTAALGTAPQVLFWHNVTWPVQFQAVYDAPLHSFAEKRTVASQVLPFTRY